MKPRNNPTSGKQSSIASTSIDVVIVEDHTLMREGLRRILGNTSGIRVVADTGNGRSALELVEKYKPGVVLVDLMLPDVDGLDLLRLLAAQTTVIAVSMRNDAGMISDALRNGARGYVVKESSPAELADAITEVAAGRRYISKGLAFNAETGGPKRQQQTPAGPLPITKREASVLRWSAEGATAPQIAKRLSLSPRTVEMHRNHLMRKLHLKSQTDLVRFAIRHKIISP